MSELVGQALGQYRVVERIGQGGMARVYKAYQPVLDRYVAVKVIAASGDSQQEHQFRSLFVTEARLVANLVHPHIVPIHDFGEDEGWAFIVMEYVGNGTMRDRIAQADSKRVRLSLPWSLQIIEQAASALALAHSHHVVHRDVKPGNMLLRDDTHLLLSDFGIATILAARQEATQDGVGGTVGTPQYMAPEQGASQGTVDGRTDIYALGVVLYQCVTGRLPFVGDTPMATIMKHMHQPVPQPSQFVPDLPPEVERIILRALQKDPAQRYQQAEEMVEDLRVALTLIGDTGRRSSRTIPIRALADSQRLALYPVVQPAQGVPGAAGTCFRCGAANNPMHRFCTSCGYELSGQRAAVDRYLQPNGHPLRCRLVFRDGLLAGRAFVLHQDATTLGRTSGNDLIIPDGTVSRRHARLMFENGTWLIEDTGSSNGTWINGVRIMQPTTLRPGDEVRLGDEVVRFELVE